MSGPAPLIRETEAARILDVSPMTLRHWRSAGTGPSYVKIGGRVRYRTSDLDDWIEAQVIAPAGERSSRR